MAKVTQMTWEVIEVFPEHGTLNVEFRAEGKVMKWYIPWSGTQPLSELINAAGPQAAAAIEKMLEPDPTLMRLLGGKGSWAPSVTEDLPVDPPAEENA